MSRFAFLSPLTHDISFPIPIYKHLPALSDPVSELSPLLLVYTFIFSNVNTHYIFPVNGKEGNLQLTHLASHTQNCPSLSPSSSVPTGRNSSFLKRTRVTSCTFATMYNRLRNGEVEELGFWFVRKLAANGRRKVMVRSV